MIALDLPSLGFGGAPVGGLFDAVTGKVANETLQSTLDHGIRYFDTVPYYGFGLSERRIGDAIRGRDHIITSSKVGRLMKPGLPGDPPCHGWPTPLPFHPVHDYSYDGVMRSYEDSLQRPGRNRIDILFIHDIGAFTHNDPTENAHHFDQAMTGGHRALSELR